MKAYELDYKYRNCKNCVHYDQPMGDIAGIRVGGCATRINRDPSRFRCAQWYLKPLTETEY